MVDLPCEMTIPPSSDITISAACFRELEALKKHASYDYITFKYQQSTNSIEIDKFGDPGSTYEQFVADLPTNEPVYAVKRLTYTMKNGSVRTSIFFVLWCPDTARIKMKMIIASQKQSFWRSISSGIDCEIGATDPGEIAQEVVLDKLRTLHRVLN